MEWRSAVVVFGLTCAWVATWLAAGPEARPNLFFREGGPIDLLNSTWLVGAAVLFWLARVIGARSPLGPFWGVAALGLLFLGIDERFQGHEILSRELDAPTPLGMRNWSDVVVLGYAVVAACLVAWRWGELWGARRLRWLGIAALGLATISTVIDSVLPSSEAKDLWEESFKVLSGAGLFLVSLEALRMTRVRPDRAVDVTPRRWILPVTAAVLAVAVAVLVQNEDWRELMTVNWGSPPSWLACVLLWVSAQVLLVARPDQRAADGLRHPEGEPRSRFMVPAFSAYLVILGAGEGIEATRFRLLDDLVADQFPATLSGELTFLQGPLGLPGFLFLFSASAMAVILICGNRPSGSFIGLSVSGLCLLSLALIVEQLGGAMSEDVYAPALRIAGAASCLLASLSLAAPRETGAERRKPPLGVDGRGTA